MLLILPLLLPGPAWADPSPTALAPIEVFAHGFRDLRGLAWGPDGALYASDRVAGVIYRLAPDPGGGARITVRQAGLDQPAGLTWSPDGSLVVVEEGRGQIVRLNGTPAPIWTGLHHPTWVAVGPDGTLYATAQQSAGTEAKPAGADAADGVRLFRLRLGAAIPDLLLSGLHEPGGLWLEPGGTLLVSLEKRSHESERQGTGLLRVNLALPPTAAAFLSPLVGAGLHRPVGPAVEVLGVLLLGARHSAPWGPLGAEATQAPEGLLIKVAPAAPITLLGSGFGEVRALTLDPQGHLYVATQDAIYRLRAPAPPQLEPPSPFTNQPALPSGARPPSPPASRSGAGPRPSRPWRMPPRGPSASPSP